MKKSQILKNIVKQEVKKVIQEQQGVIKQIEDLADDVMQGHLDQNEASPFIIEIDYMEIRQNASGDWSAYVGAGGYKSNLQFNINNIQGVIKFLQWIRSNTDSKITIWTK